MSIASEIERIQSAKASLKSSINAKNDSQHQITDESIDEFIGFVGNIPSLDSLQSKSVTITENTTTNITADSGYNGLSSVSVTTNVSGGDTPTKGIILSDWDSDGYPATLEIVGLTQIPNYYFHMANDSGVTESIFKKANIILPNNLTSIGWYAFSFMGFSQITFPNTLTTINPQAFNTCKYLTSIILPNSLTTLGQGAFGNCANLESVTLPSSLTILSDSVFSADYKLETINLNSLTSIGNYVFNSCSKLVITETSAQTIGNQAFYGCALIKKLCLPNIQTVGGNSQANSSFRNCTGLKQVWIGGNVTTAGLQRYAFTSCTALEKIYINLPRATVEAMTGYSYAFCNDTSKTGIIVCNDDSGFITKTEFDALVVE